jgi:hypothetical protein
MRRKKPKEQYFADACYTPDWGDNSSNTACAGTIYDDEDDALQYAAGLTARMRRDGASSATRLVRVRHRREADAPPLYQASYYDPAQGLTDAEVYTARVHDWHAVADRLNRHYKRTNAAMQAGYRLWPDEWGPKPLSCRACNTSPLALRLLD